MRRPPQAVRDRRRLGVAGLALLTALSLTGFAAGPAGAAGARAAQGDPTKSVSPSRAFVDACFHVTGKTKAQRACDKAALRDFDKVRATEGLAPMTLPNGFATLPAARQLLVLTNIERVDRGLRTFPGLSKRLNGLAAKGAKAGTDPPFPSPFPGDFGGGNWAGVGTSALLADYVWMYDDGPDSPNGDCPKKSSPGCWGHRHNILHAYDRPLRMGAAVAQHGRSMAAEYIGGDSADHVSTARWSHTRQQFPVGVSRRHLVVRASPGGSAHRRLTIWASGEAMRVRLRLAAGKPGWSISRRSCRLKAGHSCSVTVTERPADGSVHHTSLSVTGPNGKTTVRLAGRPTG
jgi:hypothetical protein